MPYTFTREIVVEQYPGPFLEREKSIANEEQLALLKAGVEGWNKWREENPNIRIDLSAIGYSGNLYGANLRDANLREADLRVMTLKKSNLQNADLSGADMTLADLSSSDLVGADLTSAILKEAKLDEADLSEANLHGADLQYAHLWEADLRESILVGANLDTAVLNGASLVSAKLEKTDLRNASLVQADLQHAILRGANLERADLERANLTATDLTETIFLQARLQGTILGNSDMRSAKGLESVDHYGPSSISTDTLARSNGQIPKVFLRGCGLSDWEIESVKLYNPDLTNADINNIQYRIYDLRGTQALQISPLFVSYSHGDGEFVNKIGGYLTSKGVRFWRDIHDMKAGRMEKQIDRAIRQNPTVLLVLSENSLSSDWVEHEVRTARELEKEMGRDVLCPVALDDSWRSSRWPKRLMEQIMEYNILDFSEWKDDSKFSGMFRKLIDGLELFYKG